MKKVLLLFVMTVFIITGGVVLYRHWHPSSPQSTKEIRLTGIITKVINESARDGSDSIVVGGKTIVYNQGGLQAQCTKNCLVAGKVIWFSGKPQKGQKAEVYARLLVGQVYTIYATGQASPYYIKLSN